MTYDGMPNATFPFRLTQTQSRGDTQIRQAYQCTLVRGSLRVVHLTRYQSIVRSGSRPSWAFC